ncbi:TetR/AcrR family transcriptional regulator [Methylopila sp. Yamaguchi]|uniref:TetR/AcrR family transcriptional regulator n=1 Tax=Methylopila sp. Yamaguchi TaxID=1437817 RepID=UPI001FCE3301|nr:TetR/AcrR family transcriptional regulator [Methylopila sp. Yamaguchi]
MRERVLDAAERLLGRGAAAFSMRDLAEEAGVSFATPFNQFGSKAAIMLALSARRIDAMSQRLATAALPDDAGGRVLVAVDVAVEVMLGAPDVNRAVMAAIGSPGAEPGGVSSNSSAYWTEALGAGAGLAAGTRLVAIAALPDQLAVAFRGVLSFWTAGEIPAAELTRRARAAAAAVLLGFVERDGRRELLALLEAASGASDP